MLLVRPSPILAGRRPMEMKEKEDLRLPFVRLSSGGHLYKAGKFGAQQWGLVWWLRDYCFVTEKRSNLKYWVKI